MVGAAAPAVPRRGTALDTSADGTSRRDAIGKLSQLLEATSAGALLSLLLSIGTLSLLP
jgi:hypothetical protein